MVFLSPLDDYRDRTIIRSRPFPAKSFPIHVAIYYVNNATYINQQLLKVKILATCFSYSEPPSGRKRNLVLVHSVIVHSAGSHIVYILYCGSYVG